MDEPHRTSLEYAELDATTLCPAGPREGIGEVLNSQNSFQTTESKGTKES